MTELTGQCHCGKNHIRVTNTPESQVICYCTDCRVLNSGGHLCGMMFNEADFKPPEDTCEYRYPGGSGNPIILHFCSICGTHLYSTPKQYPGKVVIRANVLNEVDFKPQQGLFSESAFTWDSPLKL